MRTEFGLGVYNLTKAAPSTSLVSCARARSHLRQWRGAGPGADRLLAAVSRNFGDRLAAGCR
ncbi:MAG: hypothetical protein R2713_18640 [Ilumatobacteraceae bacterium]